MSVIADDLRRTARHLNDRGLAPEAVPALADLLVQIAADWDRHSGTEGPARDALRRTVSRAHLVADKNEETPDE